MVGVGMLAGAGDGLIQTAHAAVPRPEEFRQVAAGFQPVLALVAGHARPVDAAHIFAPAEYLTNEPLRRVDRHLAAPPGGVHGAADLLRAQEPDIERGRQA